MLLFRRPDAAFALVHGTMVALQLAPLRLEDLTEVRDAFVRAAALAGGPVPLLSVFRLDPRFPLSPGFDGNVQEFSATLGVLRAHIRAIGVSIEFDGFAGAAMRSALVVVRALTGHRPPIAAHRSGASAVAWLAENHGVARESARELLSAIGDLSRELGADHPG